MNLAMGKSEVVLLTKRLDTIMIQFLVGDKPITSKPAIKYLWMHLDTKLSLCK